MFFPALDGTNISTSEISPVFLQKRCHRHFFWIFLSDSSFWLFGFPIIFQLKTYSKIVFFQFFVRFFFLAASFTIKNIIQNLAEIVFPAFSMTSRWHRHLKKWNFTRFFAKEVPQTLFLDLFVRFFFLVVLFFLSFFHFKTYSKIVFFQFFVRFFFLAASFTIKNIIQNLVRLFFSAFSMTSRWHRHLKKWNFTRFLAKEVPQTLFLDLFVRFFFLVVWFSNHFSIKNLFKNRFFQFFVRFSFLAASFTIKKHNPKFSGDCFFPAFSMTSRWHRHLEKWNFTRFLAKEVPQTLFWDLFVRFFFLVVLFFLSFFN